MRLPAPTSTLVTVGESGPAPATMASRVDPEGARRMMDILINLYADRRLAVVREYVSNAVDATRAVGSAKPVEITTPTELEPNLVITDHGIGMSAADVEATYLAFAASTKRDSNDMIGGLGVGAKSALTLAESFLVDTVKDGRRTVVRAARDLTHQVLLSDSPSELPTGTTITIPVNVEGQLDTWRQVIAEVASAHSDAAVRVDGAAVESLAGGPTWIGPVSCRRIGDRTVTIRSGGTLFTATPEIARQVLSATNLQSAMIELPIGSFDHTPSRESVIASDRTAAAVDAALAEYKIAYGALEHRIDTLSVTDVAAAAALRSATLGTVGRSSHLPIPFSVSIPADLGARISVPSRSSRSGKRRWDRVTEDHSLFLATQADTVTRTAVLVTGVPKSRALRNFSTFLSEQHADARWVLPVREGQSALLLPVVDGDDNPTGQMWAIDENTFGVTHYTWERWSEQVAVQRAPRTGSGGGAPGYECTVIAHDGADPTHVRMSAPEIVALGLPVWYVCGVREAHTHLQPGSTASVAVYLGRRKERVLLAAVPGAMTRDRWIADQFSVETAGWSREQLLAAAYANRQYGSRWEGPFTAAAAALELIAPGAAQATLLRRAAAIPAMADTLSGAQMSTMDRLASSAGAHGVRRELGELCDALNTAYPLLRHMRNYGTNTDQEHFAAYLAHTPPRALPTGNPAAV